MKNGFLLLAILTLAACGIAKSSSATSVSSNEWAIHVQLYRGDPSDRFEALDKLGVLILDEISKGFVKKSVVTRDGFHRGVTACILIDSRLHNAQLEKDRIVDAIENIQPDGQAITFVVSNPSTCL